MTVVALPVLVHLGPSLPRAEARALLDAEYRPPVKRGDLPSRFEGVVVIVDGEFGQNLSVSPKEILRLLDGGTRVVGASSMGALRAVELQPYGMEGHGWVYEAYRSGRIVADDEVALCYREDDWRPITVPLVNVRYWLDELRRGGHVDDATARRLLHRARRTFFADRTQRQLLLDWSQVLDAPMLARLLSAVGPGITDVKAADARAVLRHVAGRTAGAQQRPLSTTTS